MDRRRIPISVFEEAPVSIPIRQGLTQGVLLPSFVEILHLTHPVRPESDAAPMTTALSSVDDKGDHD
jgi:hypothetical protein